jgi:hypothetical protein
LYKFTDAELAELKIEFGNYDTSGDGRCVFPKRQYLLYSDGNVEITRFGFGRLMFACTESIIMYVCIHFEFVSLYCHGLCCGSCFDSIDAAEVTIALEHLNEYLSPKQVAELIKEVDSSGNGQIEFGEFVYMVGQIRLGKINVLGKIVSSNKVSAYKFTDAELGELKTEFGSYDTSDDGRFVFIFYVAVSCIWQYI